MVESITTSFTLLHHMSKIQRYSWSAAQRQLRAQRSHAKDILRNGFYLNIKVGKVLVQSQPNSGQPLRRRFLSWLPVRFFRRNADLVTRELVTDALALRYDGRKVDSLDTQGTPTPQ